MRVFNVNCLLNAFTSLLILSYPLFPTSANARALHTPIACVKDCAWFVGIGGGAYWLHQPSNTSVNNGSTFPPPFNKDTFTANNPSTGIAQLNIGYVTHTTQRYFPYWSIYLQYRHYFPVDIGGAITQYSIPAFQNYNYEISYEADLYTINGKVGLFQLNQLIPFVSGGLGVITNHLNDYSESPTPNVTLPRVSPAYNGNTDTNLALSLGVGLDFLINRCATLTVGYDHVFQGHIESGPGAGTWSRTRLDFGNANMDTVFINLAWNFSHT